MDKWKRVKLGDIAEMCLGKMLNKETNKGNLQPYLANINVRWGSFDLADLKEMRFEENEQERYGLKFGDIVMCEGGEPGRCAIWKEDIPNMKIQKALHRVRIIGDYSNEFVYYRFLLAGRNGELEKHFIGSTIKHLTGIVLKKVEFAYPSQSEQQKIAAVLSSLDAKIELNQRINAELEAMAKTLYDYWFVQNARTGKWKTGKLGDFIKVNEQSITKDYPHNEIQYIDIASVSIGRLDGATKYLLNDAPSRARRLVRHGDTIWSTVRPNRKSYLFICNPQENLVVSTGFAVLTPKNIPPSFLYFLTTTEQFVNYLVSNAEGSAYPAVSADRFAEMEFPVPPEYTLTEFENVVSPMLTKIWQNELESQTLTELRDWLLPMLMNGQVTIS